MAGERGGALFEALEPDVRLAAKQRLAAVVERSIGTGQVARLMVYCRLLPQIGRAEVLADIANSLSEHIHEQGRSGELEAVLADVLVSPKSRRSTSSWWPTRSRSGRSTSRISRDS